MQGQPGSVTVLCADNQRGISSSFGCVRKALLWCHVPASSATATLINHRGLREVNEVDISINSLILQAEQTPSRRCPPGAATLPGCARTPLLPWPHQGMLQGDTLQDTSPSWATACLCQALNLNQSCEQGVEFWGWNPGRGSLMVMALVCPRTARGDTVIRGLVSLPCTV